jgi:hypothetical protein
MTYETPAEIAAREKEREKQVLSDAIGPLHAKIDIQGRQIAELEAMLCGVLTMLSNSPLSLDDNKGRPQMASLEHLLNKVDWNEVGITQESLMAWWAEHKAEDARRKAAEQVILAVKRRKALAKLTPEERALLGIG